MYSNFINGQLSIYSQVTVKMKGDKGIMRPKPLKKKIGVNFVFGRGTTETFYIKGPDIGDIKLLAMEVRFLIFNSTLLC